MATYKCRDCSHEIISDFCPSKCEICDGSTIMLLNSTASVGEVDKPTSTPIRVDRDILHTKSSTSSLVPPAIKGWNWGAFLLGLFWSIDNRVWVGLLCVIPYVGFVMIIVLGIKGNEWAWKSRSWSSIEQFKARQRGWAIAGIIISIIFFIIGLLAGL